MPASRQDRDKFRPALHGQRGALKRGLYKRRRKKNRAEARPLQKRAEKEGRNPAESSGVFDMLRPYKGSRVPAARMNGQRSEDPRARRCAQAHAERGPASAYEHRQECPSTQLRASLCHMVRGKNYERTGRRACATWSEGKTKNGR